MSSPVSNLARINVAEKFITVTFTDRPVFIVHYVTLIIYMVA
jgi:hypothetical protein